MRLLMQDQNFNKIKTDTTLRFQKHPIALVCDIAEMYLRIEIHPMNQIYQRFL